jgi:thiol-disulfide isomerase/thioredoxin
VGAFLLRHQTKLLIAITLGSAVALIWMDDHRQILPKGKPAPEIQLHLLGKSEAVTLATLHGQPALLDFWATWCHPCRASLPHLNELAKKYDGRAHIIAVNAESEEQALQVVARDQLKLEFPIAFDGVMAAGVYHVERLPTTVLLDKDGRVADTFEGPVSPESLSRALDKLLL